MALLPTLLFFLSFIPSPGADRMEKPFFLPDSETGMNTCLQVLAISIRELQQNCSFSGRMQICVASSSMCWGMPFPAHLVVVRGTQFCDGRANAQLLILAIQMLICCE
uniref:Uncharacterized protein LOC105050592 isoform X2 n=1 Tax=Elaeis guineensis var. tenera TaxID=51953 RepID=A0A6J0PLV2_ELAGV|nr:uncharacterized protein LOC105050592 isoform X2 [Elaeis guineensis]